VCSDLPLVVYWLVLFSIIVHGLSVPALNALYKLFKVPCICDHPVEVVLLSENEPLPNNSTLEPGRHSIILNNRFSRAPDEEAQTRRFSRDDTEAILNPSEESEERPCTQESMQKVDRAVDTRDMV
jgi:hypothetical protein